MCIIQYLPRHIIYCKTSFNFILLYIFFFIIITLFKVLVPTSYLFYNVYENQIKKIVLNIYYYNIK